MPSDFTALETGTTGWDALWLLGLLIVAVLLAKLSAKVFPQPSPVDDDEPIM